ncbi:MAG TPA: hypothetical protein ENG62_03085, partial [Thermoplasmatales archaeon]|nr:hypothetical protein [Thermoplasmatales archaeon]
MIRYPLLVYHYENNHSVDIQPIINFINYRWRILNNIVVQPKIMIIGSPPSSLLRKLVAAPPVGAMIYEENIEIWRGTPTPGSNWRMRIDRGDIVNLRDAIEIRSNINLGGGGNSLYVNVTTQTLSDETLHQLRNKYWREINRYVITEDDYGAALLAALYASKLNAPLLFQGHYDLMEIKDKRVFLVGEFTDSEIEEIESYAHIENRYSIDELQDTIIAAGARYIILVNPLDTIVGFNVNSTIFGLNRFYYKQSLLAPILAAAKRGVIVETPSLSYAEIDGILQEFIDNHFHGSKPSIIILAAPSSIPMARPNYPSTPVLNGNHVYYEVFNYNDIDIKASNIETGYHTIYSHPGHQFAPYIEYSWSLDEVGGRSIRRLMKYSSRYLEWIENTQVDWILGQPCGGSGSVVFYNYSKETNNDVYVLRRGVLYQVAHTEKDECNPCITPDDSVIVWQEKSTGDWDIAYDRGIKTVIERDGNQVNPSAYGDIIVCQDDLNGNWDIHVINISSDYSFTIPHTGDQILPRVWGDRIVWQDNRYGNWDIYMYDLSTGVETQVTVDENDQILPRVYGDIIVWQDNRNGNWDIYMYNL